MEPGPEADSLARLAQLEGQCTRCPLYKDATQAVPGEGRPGAPVMLIGEQPGDREDSSGRPFVGPAGQLLDRALAEAGIDRQDCYVTNAVKHFKHRIRGKRRIHQSPSAGEIGQCRWWLEQERKLVGPRVVVALGASAAYAVLRRRATISSLRGRAVELEDGQRAFVTIHPSYLLRIRDRENKAREYAGFTADLARVAESF